MTHPNLALIDRFFEAYARRDMAALRQVLSDNVQWFFPGRNPASGTKTGIAELVAFFDTMGGIMGSSNVQVEKLVTGAGDQYVVEAQHIRTERKDGHNMDQHWCVLWKFAEGKITEGRHLAGDQYAVDAFFGSVMR